MFIVDQIQHFALWGDIYGGNTILNRNIALELSLAVDTPAPAVCR